jgi:hypothetical protein
MNESRTKEVVRSHQRVSPSLLLKPFAFKPICLVRVVISRSTLDRVPLLVLVLVSSRAETSFLQRVQIRKNARETRFSRQRV